MKILAVTVKIKKTKIDEAKRFFRSFIAPSRAESGCVQYEALQSTDNPQIFYFFEKWKSPEAFKAHNAQPFLIEFHNRFGELLEEPNQRLWLNPID